MKRILVLIFAISCLIVSCKDECGIDEVTATIKIDESGINEECPKPASYDVNFVNTNSLVTIVGRTENGMLVSPKLLPGVYDINVSTTVNSGPKSYIISGSLKNVEILKDGNEYTLKLVSVKSASLIFKEVYYCGAKSNDFYYKDQFYEIYNNSNSVVYADGLCIGRTLWEWTSQRLIFEKDGSIADNNKMVFFDTVWQIPGNGKDYPIKPGESIIIAQWATDHIKISGGESTVNLIGADFEALEKENKSFGKNPILLTDNPAINMINIVNVTGRSFSQWLTPVFGSSLAIFYPSYELNNDNSVVYTTTNLKKAKSAVGISVDDVLDAVQFIKDPSVVSKIGLGLPTVLDAGYQTLGGTSAKGIYIGKSFCRKIAGKDKEGHILFQDTNNTTNDFELFDTPVPHRYNTPFPSWNTWNK